jgi:uncharacterized membrane protein
MAAVGGPVRTLLGVLGNGHWMTWNLLLAAVPAALACGLFRQRAHRSLAWWAGVAVFVLFLPNAPYVLTDVVHFIDDVRNARSDAAVVFVIMPVYAAFALLGFGAYVVSLRAIRRYLVGVGRAAWAAPAELALHGLCAVGIWLGRFHRFNSWDVVTRPTATVEEVADGLMRTRPQAIVLLTFTVIAVLGTAGRFVLDAVTDRVRRP